MRRKLSLDEEVERAKKAVLGQLRLSARTLGKIARGIRPAGVRRDLTPLDIRRSNQLLIWLLEQLTVNLSFGGEVAEEATTEEQVLRKYGLLDDETSQTTP